MGLLHFHIFMVRISVLKSKPMFSHWTVVVLILCMLQLFGNWIWGLSSFCTLKYLEVHVCIIPCWTQRAMLMRSALSDPQCVLIYMFASDNPFKYSKSQRSCSRSLNCKQRSCGSIVCAEAQNVCVHGHCRWALPISIWRCESWMAHGCLGVLFAHHLKRIRNRISITKIEHYCIILNCVFWPSWTLCAPSGKLKPWRSHRLCISWLSSCLLSSVLLDLCAFARSLQLAPIQSSESQRPSFRNLNGKQCSSVNIV